MAVELKDLISAYQDPILPLLNDIKHRNNNKIPDNCLNEIRAVVDHVGRCYFTDDEERINIEMGKAEGHIQRLTFDCFKQLNIFLYDGLKSKMRWFFSPYWLKIDNGKFWKHFYADYQMVIKNIVKAKETESLNADKAMEYYAKVYAGYIRIEQLIRTHKRHMCWSMLVKAFLSISHFMNWLVITVIAALLSALIIFFVA